MKYAPLPDYFELHRILEYHDGKLYWKVQNARALKVGQQAGYTTKRGHLTISINSRVYLVHRIIWKMMKGYDPTGIIDHIDQNPNNNKIENLRDTNHTINRLNRPSKGCSYRKNQGIWVATFTHKGKPTHLGYFKTQEEAKSRYEEFKELYWEMFNA